MKKRLCFVLMACFAVLCAFARDALATFDKETSYAFGVVVGGQLAGMEIEFSKQQFTNGFYEQMEDTAAVSFEEAILKITALLDKASEESFVIDADASYAMGVAVGYQLVSSGIMVKFDKTEFFNGLSEELAGSSRIPADEAGEKITGTLEMANEVQAQENLEKSGKFLAVNGKKKGVTTTKSGLQYAVSKAGAGKKPAAESVVTVNYEGRLIDGTVFDSSYERGEPSQFPLGDVIPGWTEGIQLMRVGGKFTFYIPPSLGYGDMTGLPIPPNSVLVFDVELLAIE